ncbi:hypothetical protein BGZ60DRAFT_545644 [Tricladium varicosporioides]|nr:hypothetical protein BGZ60DRAFT_545644 [Hymenoscyphus varicosporioides]
MIPPTTPSSKSARSSKRAPRSAPAKSGSDETDVSSPRPTTGGKTPITANGRRPVGGKGPILAVQIPKASPNKVHKNVCSCYTNVAIIAHVKARKPTKKETDDASKKINTDEEYADEDLGEAEAREYQEYLIDQEVRDEGVQVKPEWHEDEEGGAGIIVPVSRNGRVVGRKLIMWHRARMYEKILLMIIFETYRDGYQIPWDRVVQRLSPGSTGASAVQHFNRLRYILLSEGHLVPPPLGKLGSVVPPYVRGYVRDMDSDNIYATRVVQWDEKVEDRKESLEIPGLVRGSGNYRKSEKVKSVSAGQVHEVVAKKPDLITPEDKLQFAAKTPKRLRTSRAKSNKLAPKINGEADPAELDSEDDYAPGAVKRCRRSTRKRAVIKPEPASDDDTVNNETFANADTEVEDDIFCATPQINSETIKPMSQPRSGLRVKLGLSSKKLSKFPAGESGDHLKSLLSNSLSSRNPPICLGNSRDENEDITDSPSFKASARLHSGYAGPSIHGNIDEIVAKFKHGGSSRGSGRIPNNGLLPNVKPEQGTGGFMNAQDLIVNRAEVQYPIYNVEFERASRDNSAYNAGMNIITNDPIPWNRERNIPGPFRYDHNSNLSVFRLDGQGDEAGDEILADNNVLANITDATFHSSTAPEHMHERNFNVQDSFFNNYQPGQYNMNDHEYATPREQWESMTAVGDMNTYNNAYNGGNMLFGHNSIASRGYSIHEDMDDHPLAHANLEVRFATAEELNSIFSDSDENTEPSQYTHPTPHEENSPFEQGPPLEDDDVAENRIAHAKEMYEATAQLQEEAEAAELGYMGDEPHYHAASWDLE